MQVFNDGSWSDAFKPSAFVATILEAICSAWSKINPSPSANTLENVINRQICGIILNDPDLRRLPFHVISNWEILEADGSIRGIPDIRFSPYGSNDRDDFCAVECKRLRFANGSNCVSGNSEYLNEAGMQAFVDGCYPAPHGIAMMVGYILCDCVDPVLSLSDSIAANRGSLKMSEDAKLTPRCESGVFYETEHHLGTGMLLLKHVLLRAPGQKTVPPKKRQRKNQPQTTTQT